MSLRAILFTIIILLHVHCRNHKADDKEATIKDVYAVMRILIEQGQLDRSYGLAIEPDSTCFMDQKDELYLQSLRIRPEPLDTIIESDSAVVTNFSYPDRNLFTEADIAYILRTKKAFEHFVWNSKELPFNPANTINYYSFSFPYFNLAHDRVIVRFELHCPGLCGTGSTIILNRTKNGWEQVVLERWIH